MTQTTEEGAIGWLGGAEHSDAILARLTQLHPKLIDLSLDRLYRLLAALGEPHKRLPPVVHVAGTNGKGSVCAYLRAGLEADGDRVHVYTSPHLARFHERIRVAGKLIDEARLADVLRECEAANGDAPITYFEITTAAALLEFSRVPAERCVLEVGLGGRLDATNVVERPELCVITPVSLDHQRLLGETVAEIAAEKAGILKPGVPCVVAEQTADALDAIERAARRIGAPLAVAERDWRAWSENGRLVVERGDELLDLPQPRLLGRHQIGNAGAAAVALRMLGVPESAIAAAMETVEWPARMQRLRRGPLADFADGRMELWLDGGHNISAGAALAGVVGEMEEAAPQPLYLICGMIEGKDPAGFLRSFQGLARRVYAVAVPGDASTSLPAETVASAAVGVGLQAQIAGSVEGALRAIAADIENDYSAPQPRVLICGSLYLAGYILRENG